MTEVQSVGMNAVSTYNAVKIRVNNPQASVPAELNGTKDGEFNAVNIEVNNPKLDADKKPVYNYPTAQDMVTYDKLGITPLEIPELPIYPVAYKTSFVNNRTFINAEFADEKKTLNQAEKSDNVKIIEENPNSVLQIEGKNEQEPVFIELTEVTAVPVPNVITSEDEKLASSTALNFHGINFKAAKPEIVPDGNLKPSVDSEKIAENIKSDNFRIQEQQLGKLMALAVKKSDGVAPYLNTTIFSAIIDVINKDNSNLEKPSKEQEEIREKVLLNEFAKEQQIRSGKKADDVVLPYKISAEEFALANKLSPFEMAEYNKMLGIYTLSSLDNALIDEFKKQTGNVMAVTDIPGINDIIELLSSSSDLNLKVSAMDALMDIKRPEYKNELIAVFQVLTEDNDSAVSTYAKSAIKELNNL